MGIMKQRSRSDSRTRDDYVSVDSHFEGGSNKEEPEYKKLPA
jgi:hypothetical protein